MDNGKFGAFGGRFVAETLMAPLMELEQAYKEAKDDPTFQGELASLLRHYSGRPTPIYHAQRLSAQLGGAQIYLKREDLNHTGAHKLNNVLGQVLLAVRMGKHKIIAETGAGQHGVATATVCARFGLDCTIYMGAEDMRRQALNVRKMELLGATVTAVTEGSGTLKDATSAAIRDWVKQVEDTFYVIGSVVGPHPYPEMVRDFQRIIGVEAREQMDELTDQLPDVLVAAVGGGSNAIGLFHRFLNDEQVKMYGVEAGGCGDKMGQHAMTMGLGVPGILHGMRTLVLQDGDGAILPVHSVSAGLDYPGVGPEHAMLKTSGRATYVSVTDQQSLDALKTLTRTEGILPALESAHALAFAMDLAQALPEDQRMLVCLSGRGDKDLHTVLEQEGDRHA